MNKSQLARLAMPLLVAWTLAWLSGLSILANVAIDLRAEQRDADLDTQLALYATAVYGLTWFDASGQFHPELYWAEKDLHPAVYDIWLVEVSEESIVYLAPTNARFSFAHFRFLQAPVMQQAQKVYWNGVDDKGMPVRLYAIPTYLDNPASHTPKAMIVVVADPRPAQNAYESFVRKILLVTVLLGFAGLGMGLGLTYWSLRPTFHSFRQRERFLSATAHELRTPITALRSVCESALKGDESSVQALKRMNSLLSEASNTLNDLLLFARLDAGAGLQREAVRLDLLVESLLPEADLIKFEGEATIVNVDPRLISVVVRNGLENAYKHGKLPIHIRVTQQQISIDDAGQGFPPDFLTRHFSDFAISPSQGGTGLGLAIIHLIMRLHGGKVQLTNTAQGARILLTFS
ncbi:sensor histidine kinase [Thiolinea disciformis]|uniref:sensor histidine kinase n=1 Tax=Thiolinea disciformis TaxID=125614 RepID=UPI000374D97D|nr:HAMP domain-containing sensor histidine kinase [Thiolinea disciformis]